ncbi:MAG TPA: tRNA lysidine(34) synthetase TilS [Candidatus Tripitaka californicus]|uniref:tRNA lysidine(34) synthetase TilS n=1 Tax=Candidatus Tripitaka californicus TaxID=3367616 RepID=UPI004025FFD5
MKAFELERRVREFISMEGMLMPGEGVVVAVSGGPDSVALLRLLHDLDKSQGWGGKGEGTSPLHVAHLNHMLRGEESEGDERFVQGLASGLGLGFTTKRVDVRQEAVREKCAIEETARRARYSFFEGLARELGRKVVAVGHTADDNAETVLHTIIRGTGLTGLAGMRPVREISRGSGIRLSRPLLSSWRQEILDYLKEKDMSYRIDSSNLQVGYLRNRIRLELLPLLGEYNPRVKESLVRLAETAGKEYAILEEEAKKIIEAGLTREEMRYILETTLLKGQASFLQHLVFREVLGQIGLPLKRVDSKHYEGLCSLVEGWAGPISLPCGWEAEGREGRRIFTGWPRSRGTARRAPTQRKLDETTLNIPGTTRLSDETEIKAEVVDLVEGFLKGFKRTKTKEEEIFDLDRLELPLLVRTRRPGDRFWPIGAGGEKKLKDFFIDEKIPRPRRDDWPLVCDSKRPVWVVGLRMDERVKITSDTGRAI